MGRFVVFGRLWIMDTQTALIAIASGVVVPVVTSILANPRTPSQLKRFLPVALAAVGGLVIMGVKISAGEQVAPSTLVDWLTLTATVVGISQALYAAMPKTWKKLETVTSTVNPAENNEPMKENTDYGNQD